MKQTVISRMISSLAAPRRVAMAMICMMLLISVPNDTFAQRRGGERTERRDNHNGRRNENRRDNSRKQSNNNKNHSNPQASPGDKKNHGHNATPGNRPGKGQNNEANRNPANNVRPGNNDRPGPGNNTQGYRPGAAGNNQRPPEANRPGPGNNNPGNNMRPGNNRHPGGPVHTWTPGAPNKVKPGHTIHRPPMAPPPPHPMRPAHFYGYSRPVPPPAWRPGPQPLFSTVLGLTFGTAMNIAIDALITNGYAVDGYTDNMVYVNDAVQLNMRWPFGVLLYNNGLLCGSEFTYSSDWRDLNRYNMAYARLSSLYGPPVSNNRGGGNLSATWWGPGGQYVTLRFDYRAPMSGRNRYYTTLSFGM